MVATLCPLMEKKLGKKLCGGDWRFLALNTPIHINEAKTS